MLKAVARRQWLAVTAIGLVAFVASAAIGLLQGFPEPRANDEFSYLLAADTFVHGRLTNPSHPMWVHFESSHVIHQPTYMSKYPPAQGLILAAGRMIFGHPIWGVWMSFGFMCAAICWLLYVFLPPRWAIMGGIFAIINPLLGVSGYWAQSYWGGALAATGGALVIGALPRLIDRSSWRSALAMGLGLALLANSRPYEGLVIALPVGIVLLVSLVKKPNAAPRRFGGGGLIPLLFVLALLAASIGYYNIRVTGSAVKLPYQVYEETYAVVPLFVWQSVAPEPQYRHQAIRDAQLGTGLNLYTAQKSVPGFLIKNVAHVTWWAIYSLNIFLVPLIATVSSIRQWASRNPWPRFALQTYGLFILGQTAVVWLMIHYFAPVTALNYLFAVQAVRYWKWRRRRKGVGWTEIGLFSSLGFLTLGASLHVSGYFDGSLAWHRQRTALEQQLASTPVNHLILVSYGPAHPVQEEWVHNLADIDGQKVIWARAMDAVHNCRVIDYFKQRRIWSLIVDMNDAKPELKPFPAAQCRRS